MTRRWMMVGVLALLLTLGFQTRTAHAQGIFTQVDAGFPKSATAVAVDDLDRDGDLDAWLGYNGNSRIYLRSNGAWVDSGQRLGEDDFVLDVVLGDFDGDGDIDAAVLDLTHLTIWINVGGKQARAESIFEFRARFPIDEGIRLATGDLDNDSDLDLYVAQTVGRADTVWLNDGDANFSDSGLRLGNAASLDVVLGDFDGDNDLDAIVATMINSSLEPAPLNNIWINTTNHVTATPDLFIDSGQHLGFRGGINVAAADIDNDQDLDVFLGRNAEGEALWVNQGGTQGGVEGTFIPSPQNFDGPPRDVVFADVDGDNDLDVVKATNGVGVWLNQAGIQQGQLGEFAFRGQTLQTAAERVAVGDFNGDTTIDLIVAPYDNDSPTTYWESGDAAAVEVYQNLRDDHMRGFAQGRHYISLYEQFTGEILQLMLTDPNLSANLWAGIDLWRPTIQALITDQGDDTFISLQQVNALDDVLEILETVGSQPLQAAIAEERAALGKPLDEFTGMSVSQASSSLLGTPSFLLFVPTLHQSNAQSSTLETTQDTISGTAQWTVRQNFQNSNFCMVLCIYFGYAYCPIDASQN